MIFLIRQIRQISVLFCFDGISMLRRHCNIATRRGQHAQRQESHRLNMGRSSFAPHLPLW